MVQSLNVSGIVNAFRVIWNPSLAMPHIIVNGKLKEEKRVLNDQLKSFTIVRHSLHQLF